MASIRQRTKNSYQITVSVGYDSNNKKITKQQTVKRPEGMTDIKWKKQLDILAAEFEASVKRGTYFEPTHYKLSDFIDKWLMERGNDFENKTRFRYEGMLRGRINEALGHLKIEQIKPLHLLDFYRNMQEVGIRKDTSYISTPAFKKLISDKKIDLPKLAIAAKVSERTLKGILSGKATNTADKILKALNNEYKLNVKHDKLFTPASEPKPLSNKTIQHYHRVLSVMFSDAVRWGMMKENPCLKVQPPKVTKDEMLCLDEEGINKMLDALESESIKIQTAITLMLATGSRRGEVCALQWQHIDFDNKALTVKQSAEYTPEYGLNIKAPKTASSIRKIAIPDSTVQLLKQYRKWWLENKIKHGDLWQIKEKKQQGDSWTDPEWLFTTWNGGLMHPDSFTDMFSKFIKRHDLPRIRLHDLRHTAATMLINAGLNIRAVASRLGHANPNVTLQVYSHALQSADREAANIMDKITSKSDKNVTEKQA